ncbi:hypothetical protein CBM2629_A50064 [Cupriavidus taiwanensis]|nr:hypothetical protein CBM2629_A50064 [Cupriavidus taiwanensis]
MWTLPRPNAFVLRPLAGRPSRLRAAISPLNVRGRLPIRRRRERLRDRCTSIRPFRSFPMRRFLSTTTIRSPFDREIRCPMLISPPFLPPRVSSQTENQWIDTAMPGGEPGNGAYPVSYKLSWHGGLHLRAPARSDGGVEPVRAIADGIVVYRRGSTEPPAAPTPEAPLGYQGRTSDGVVVIRHETETGAARQSSIPTRVVFLSVYMHMHTLRATVQPGRRIHRKDELGQAGYIRGQPHQIHFEIICDDANLRQLIGRDSGIVQLTADGRSDAIFGELYFHLAETTPVYAQCPPRIQSRPPGGAPLGGGTDCRIAVCGRRRNRKYSRPRVCDDVSAGRRTAGRSLAHPRC